MNNIQTKYTNVVTLRVPKDLKHRLEKHAKYQGVSLNQFANYLLNFEVTQLENIAALEKRAMKKKVSLLKRRVNVSLKNISSKKVHDWDVI